ncbi:MAG TPA: hypothetical protein VK543_16065 [Puia sp.]|nr:hypothetical protein [Puia sp.]
MHELFEKTSHIVEQLDELAGEITDHISDPYLKDYALKIIHATIEHLNYLTGYVTPNDILPPSN